MPIVGTRLGFLCDALSLAVIRFIEDRTRWTITQFVRTARRYRAVQIRVGDHQIPTAEDPSRRSSETPSRSSAVPGLHARLIKLGSREFSAVGRRDRGHGDPQRCTEDDVKDQIRYPCHRRESRRLNRKTMSGRCMSIASSTLWVWS